VSLLQEAFLGSSKCFELSHLQLPTALHLHHSKRTYHFLTLRVVIYVAAPKLCEPTRERLCTAHHHTAMFPASAQGRHGVEFNKYILTTTTNKSRKQVYNIYYVLGIISIAVHILAFILL
jgi:hypothetical protein